MLKRRAGQGGYLDEPVFCDALGHFRDPANVRRDLRRARSPIGSEARQQLGARLAQSRRDARLSRRSVARTLEWPATRVELIENGRVQFTDEEVEHLLDLYDVADPARREIHELADDALQVANADAFTWITSHTFRRTTATLLDEAGQSARQIADQLGHARPSLTQDLYLGRAARNPGAAAALDRALGPASEE